MTLSSGLGYWHWCVDCQHAAGTSRQRFLRINFFALLFALAANFLGITSKLLGLLPDLQGLYLLPADFTQFFPVKGWKRCSAEGAFDFIYPVEWLQDQAVALARQARGAQDQMMTAQRKRRRAPQVETVAAFGPPRGDASENVSVVKSKLPGTLALRSLGDPAEAAQRLLATALAPDGAGTAATLIEAIGEMRGSADYQLIYQFEYTVEFDDGRELHNVCAIGAKDDTLYTLTVLAPESAWESRSEKLTQVAQSFRLL